MTQGRDDEARGRHGSGRDADEGAVAYSGRDLDQFARLADFSFVRKKGVPHAPGAGPASGDAPAFHYSDSDSRAFERLMSNLGGIKSVRGVVPRSRRGASRRDYTENDNRHFSSLMDFERAGPSAKPDAGPPARGAGPAPVRGGEGVSYSASDIDAFAKISPDGREPAEGTDDSDRLHARTDRDVGPIRVVNVDEDRERSRRRARTSAAPMKIRYFD